MEDYAAVTIKVKVKVKFVPALFFLTQHHAMKVYCGSGGVDPLILDLVPDGGEWSASCPGYFTPRERASGTHW
jgi:hypothetical protein